MLIGNFMHNINNPWLFDNLRPPDKGLSILISMPPPPPPIFLEQRGSFHFHFFGEICREVPHWTRVRLLWKAKWSLKRAWQPIFCLILETLTLVSYFRPINIKVLPCWHLELQRKSSPPKCEENWLKLPIPRFYDFF